MTVKELLERLQFCLKEGHIKETDEVVDKGGAIAAPFMWLHNFMTRRRGG